MTAVDRTMGKGKKDDSQPVRLRKVDFYFAQKKLLRGEDVSAWFTSRVKAIVKALRPAYAGRHLHPNRHSKEHIGKTIAKVLNA